MSGEEEIADIDPTPIHHPVDDEAIASAVHDATADVGDDTMDQDQDQDQPQQPDASTCTHDEHINVNTDEVKLDPDLDTDKAVIHNDATSTATKMEPEDIRAMILREDEERAKKGKGPKRRARRVGRVPVRKAPKLEESTAIEATTATLSPVPVPVPVPEELVVETAVVETMMPRVLSKHDEKWNSMLKELETFKVSFSINRCHHSSWYHHHLHHHQNR